MRKIILFISLLISVQINAQELSLSKALELAKSPQKNQADLEVLKREIDLKIQKAKRLPLIYGDANLQRNLIVPVTPVPAIAFNPNALPNEITPLKFATDWSAKAGLQFSLDIFNSQNQLDIKSAEFEKKRSEISKKQTTVEFNRLIIDLYAQTYLSQLQYEVSLINETKFNETLNIILIRNKEGRASDLEKNNALQKALELELTTNEAEYVLKNKFLELANYIDISIYERLSTSIDEILASHFKNEDFDIEFLKLDIAQKNYEIKNNKLSYLPKLSFNAFYGTQFYNNQLKVYDSDYWYGNSFVNFSIRIPLTEQYEKGLKSKLSTYELEISQSKLSALELENHIFMEQNKNEKLILEQKIRKQKEIIDLISNNVEIIKVQLNSGTILISEYNSELEKLFNQNQKLWQLSYDLLMKNMENK